MGADDRFGSKCEKLSVSKSSPLRPIKLTSKRSLATSLMGHKRTPAKRNGRLDYAAAAVHSWLSVRWVCLTS